MRWKDPETGETHSIYPTQSFSAELEAFYAAECQHPRQELRRARNAGGATAIRNQCLSCGQLVGNALPKNRAPTDTKDADPDKWAGYAAEREKQRTALFRKHVEQQARDRSDFRGQHAKYLQSPEWRAKRQKVMERANGICEGCRERPATQVHHLTYLHWMDELLFELAAVCDDCHAKCHPEEEREMDGLDLDDEVSC